MLASMTSFSQSIRPHPPAGAIWELHELVRKARGDRHNCEQLDLFCQDVMRVLDIAGGHLSEVDGLRLAKLLEHVEAGIELVDACSHSGALGSRLNMSHSCGVPLASSANGRQSISGSWLGMGGGAGGRHRHGLAGAMRMLPVGMWLTEAWLVGGRLE